MGLFKTLLGMVLMHRFAPAGQFSGPLGQLFDTQWFFYAAIGIGMIEVIADLIPRFDIQWMRWNGHLRLLGGVLLPWFILHPLDDVVSKVMMVIVGVLLAFTAYIAIMSARRAAVRGGTIGFVTPISSVTENCMIGATLLPLTRLPPMTFLMVSFMCGAALLIIYMVRREARESFAWVLKLRWTPTILEDTSGLATEADTTSTV